MSIWTHIAGVIRLDTLPSFKTKSAIARVKEIFNKNVPWGSEGPLEFTVQEIRSHINILWCNVIFHGDLRDYDNIDEVEKWIRESCKACVDQLKCIIRQAIIQIEVEYEGSALLLYSSRGWKRMCLKWKGG